MSCVSICVCASGETHEKKLNGNSRDRISFQYPRTRFPDSEISITDFLCKGLHLETSFSEFEDQTQAVHLSDLSQFHAPQPLRLDASIPSRARSLSSSTSFQKISEDISDPKERYSL